MAKLDRLGWAAGFSFRAQGLRIGIRATAAGFLDDALGCLPPGARLSGGSRVDHLFSVIVGDAPGHRGVRRLNLLYADSVQATRTPHRAVLVAELERYLEETLLVASPGRLFIHSGAVSWRGLGLLVPGPSHAGKSTLVAELVRAGATYFSDEYAVIDRQGRLHPYARALKLRGDGGERSVRVEDLGGRTGARPVSIGMVAFLRFKAGGGWAPRLISPGSAALGLLRNAPAARIDPRTALSRLQPLVRGARAIEGTRGEAREAAASLIATLEAAALRRRLAGLAEHQIQEHPGAVAG